MLNNKRWRSFPRQSCGSITNETDFVADAVPGFFDVFFSLDVPGISARGTLQGGGATTPDRFIIAGWPNLHSTTFDYTVDPTEPVTDDSAVAIFWNPTTLGPGESRVLTTFYGVSSALGGGSLVVVAPQVLNTVPGNTAGSVLWSPNPFPVDIFFSNSSSNPISVCPIIVADSDSTGLITPPANGCPAGAINVPGGATIQTQLLVTAVQAGDAHYQVEMLKAGGVVVASQEVSTVLPPLIVPAWSRTPSIPAPFRCAPMDNSAPTRTTRARHRLEATRAVYRARPLFEWETAFSLFAFQRGPGGSNATPALLNDSNLDVYVYSAVDIDHDTGVLSFSS